MKTTKVIAILTFLIFTTHSIYAACDSCKISAAYTVSQDSLNNYIFTDSSNPDSCSTFLFSILDFNNGQTDTVYSVGATFDNKSGDTSNIICQTSFARYYDSSIQRWDTCSATYCDTINFASCGNCSVSAGFSSQELWDCEWRLIDTSSVDNSQSCIEHLYSRMDYGNGNTATVNPGDTFPDLLSLGTYNVCVTSYARVYNDTLQQWDTCSSQICRNITKSSCFNPWRISKPTIEEVPTMFKLYPNPTNGLINLSVGDEVNYIEILNLQGKIVYSDQVITNTNQIDLSSFDNGLYILRTYDVIGKVKNFKIVKE